ncbi:hypothetical protein CAPTEDRAFT_145619, partial [Capitella teleta]
MRFLIQRGEDVNKQNKYGASPLHLSAALGDIEIVKILLDAGADPNIKDNEAWSPLHYVSASEMFDALDFMLEQSGDECLNARDKDGSTPLHYAASVGRMKSCEILLKHGCKKSIRDNHGRTACDLAMLFGYVDVVELLREN